MSKKASVEKNKTPIHVNGSFFLHFMMPKRCTCAFGGAPQAHLLRTSVVPVRSVVLRKY